VNNTVLMWRESGGPLGRTP